jgi:hypothetical protein
MFISLVSGTVCHAYYNIGAFWQAPQCDTSNTGWVQKNSAGNTQNSLSINYMAAQKAGDTNIVFVGWTGNTGTISSINDTAGNTYQLAIGPTRSSNSTQYLYYAKNIVASSAGTNFVTVDLSASEQTDLGIYEYQGLFTASPLELTSSGAGNSTALGTASLTTIHSCDLLFSAAYLANTISAVGAAYSTRDNPGGDLVEDRVVSSSGTYNATGTQTPSGDYVMQLAAFKKNLGSLGSSTIKLVQEDFGTASGTNVSTSYVQAQIAGDINIVVVNWQASTGTISSISDVTGNSYTSVSGPIRGTALTQSIYYAKNIATSAAGANTVTVTFSASENSSVQVLEYSGLSMSAPLDVSAGSSGNSSSPSSGNVTTSFANELIIGAQTVQNAGAYTSTGPGFRPVSSTTNPSSTVISDRIVSATGTYSTSSTLSSTQHWVMGIVTFH